MMRRGGFRVWATVGALGGCLTALGAAPDSALASGEAQKTASPATLMGEGWGAEHVIVMSRELEAARSAFANLGFSATAPALVSKVLLHSLIKFENGTYLELTQFFHDPKDPKKDAISGHQLFLERYAAFVRKREGGQSIGISVRPAADTARFLRSRGFEVTDPTGDTTAWVDERSPKPDWWTVDFTKPKGTAQWLSFLEYTRHDEMLRILSENEKKGLRLESEEHFNSAHGLSEVWIAVKDLEAQAKLLEKIGFVRLEEVAKPHLQARGFRFDAGRTSLVLMTPTQEPKGPPGVLGAFLKQNGDGIFGVRVLVTDIRRALLLVRERFKGERAVITGHGDEAGRGFVVDGRFAGGLFIEFWTKS